MSATEMAGRRSVGPGRVRATRAGLSGWVAVARWFERRGGLSIGLVALGVALLTAGAFLYRAGDPTGSNWPVNFDLASSDNGVLFQVMQDVVAGRPLEWRFSPQVYFVPELPISAVAFLVTGGNIYGYYLAVAVLNNLVLFGGFLLVARLLSSSRRWSAAALRAAAAMVPLVVAPLVGTSGILEFHLAATYYFGMYLALIVAPALILVRGWPARIALGLLLALTAACDPLTLVFASPGMVAALIVSLVARGWRPTRRPVAIVVVALLVAAVAWLLVMPFQGRSAFDYVGGSVFATRLNDVVIHYQQQLSIPQSAFLLILGAVCAIACAIVAVVVAVRRMRRRGGPGAMDLRRAGTIVFLGVTPLGGIAATAVAQITHYLYFWPALILPIALVLFALPRPSLVPVTLVALVAGLVFGWSNGADQTLSLDRYYGFRTPEMVCLDNAVPGRIGYATYSDARRLSLTSTTGIQLHQVLDTARPNFWLANAAVRNIPGSFFFLNETGNEPPIDPARLSAQFGFPDRVVSCSPTESIWIYDSPSAQAAIARFYAGISH